MYELLEYDDFQVLNELGELTQTPYKWEFWGKQGTSYKYNFKTDAGLKYVVMFDEWDKSTWEVMFKVEGGSAKDLTGEGKMMTILSTVFEIFNDFTAQNKKCKSIVMTGEGKKGERTKDGTARTRIYFEVIKKNIAKLGPKANARMSKDLIIINLK